MNECCDEVCCINHRGAGRGARVPCAAGACRTLAVCTGAYQEYHVPVRSQLHWLRLDSSYEVRGRDSVATRETI
jgi:hypothetical protein